MVVAPVKVFAPASCQAPTPIFVIEVRFVTLLSLMTPVIALSPELAPPRIRDLAPVPVELKLPERVKGPVPLLSLIHI